MKRMIMENNSPQRRLSTRGVCQLGFWILLCSESDPKPVFVMRYLMLYICKTLVQDQHKKTTTLGPLARTKKYTCTSACIRLADKSRSLRPPGALASRSDISCSVPHSAVPLPRDAARLNETRTLYKFPIKISIIHFHTFFFFFPGVHNGGREKETPSTLSQGIGIHGLLEEAIPGIKDML